MQKQTLTELIRDLEQEMLRLGYTEGSMNFYRRRWKMLIRFADEHGENSYSEQLGIAFVEKHFRIFERDFQRTLAQAETQELRIIRMIGDFQLHHTVLRRYYKHKEILTDSYFMPQTNGLNNIAYVSRTHASQPIITSSKQLDSWTIWCRRKSQTVRKSALS